MPISQQNIGNTTTTNSSPSTTSGSTQPTCTYSPTGHRDALSFNHSPTTSPRTVIGSRPTFVFTLPDINPNDNIRRLLADFACHTGIDIQSESPVIEFHGLGPQSICSWTSATISQWTGIDESTVIELQYFCEEWIEALQRARGII